MILSKPVIIIGAGGHARVLISALIAVRREILGIFDQDESMLGQSVAGVPVLGNDDKIKDYGPDSIELVNGIGSVAATEKHRDVYLKFKNNGYLFAQVIHPAALIMTDVKLGEGVQIMAGAIIQSGCQIGNNTIVNTGTIMDHGCVIGDHVHIAPGAVLSGGVQVGPMTHIGTSVTVIQGINVGGGSIIGAGAVVIKDIPANVMAVGAPARLIERR
jgi:UDP-perosamine 4-acetyltransferase